MKQAIHIFKKDARHLWPAILAVLALAALYAYAGALSFPAVTQLSSALDRSNSLIQLAMPLGWWYLIAATIHEEALPGFQQFWLTRPYSWKSLLLAKALFIIAFVNLPKLLADCVILQVHGFHASSYWPNLIGSQILFTAVWVLPFAALAAVTRDLRQFSLAVIIGIISIALAPLILSSSGLSPFLSGYWVGFTWIQDFILIGIVLMASLLILFWQYSHRRTAVTRMIGIGAVVLVIGSSQLLPMRALMAMQVRWSDSRLDASQIQISLDPNRKQPTNVTTGEHVGAIQINIPILVTSLEQDRELFCDDLAVEIEGLDGKVSRVPGRIVQDDDGFWQRIFVEPPIFQKLKAEPVTLRSSAYFTLLGDKSTMRIEPQERATEVPGLGMCQLSRRAESFAMACYSPFRMPYRFAKVFLHYPGNAIDQYIEPGSYLPYPAQAGISPLVVSVRSSGSFGSNSSANAMGATIITEAPLAHCRRDFELRGLRLIDYSSSDEH